MVQLIPVRRLSPDRRCAQMPSIFPMFASLGGFGASHRTGIMHFHPQIGQEVLKIHTGIRYDGPQGATHYMKDHKCQSLAR